MGNGNESMYVPLPPELRRHVIPHLYFPYFGKLRTATSATFAINCGPPEKDYDALGTLEHVNENTWDLTRNLAETEAAFSTVPLVERPSYYFHHGRPNTYGLGRQRVDRRFWNSFNCGERDPVQNPIHREHYDTGSLVHIDAIPWATILKWGDVHPNVQRSLMEAGLPALIATLLNCPNLRRIFVRSRVAATALAQSNLGFDLIWNERLPNCRFQLASGQICLPNGRTIEVRALSLFRISTVAARALINMP